MHKNTSSCDRRSGQAIIYSVFLCFNYAVLMDKKIRVAIYEDNAGLREILAAIIRESEDFELAGTAHLRMLLIM
jgi:hypothetical protein